MQNKQVFAQKNLLMISKNNMINQKWQNMPKKMQYRHPPIQEHLVYSHLISSNMYVHVYILCNIYSAYIFICVYNAVFGGYHPVESAFQDGGEYRGKISDGHSNPIYLVLKPSKTPKFLTKFSTVHVLQICRICM